MPKGRKEMRTKFWFDGLKGKHHPKDIDVDRIILKLFLGYKFEACGLDSCGSFQ
jgi:hypothetical protein